MSMQFIVKFGEHVQANKADDMGFGFSVYGEVRRGVSNREFVVEVHSDADQSDLRNQLTNSENWGFLKWSEEKSSDK